MKPSQTKESDLYALVVGCVIAGLREAREWTQVQFAKKIGVTQPTLSRIERGQAHPDPFVIHKLAEVFSISTKTLCGVVDEAFGEVKQAISTASEARPVSWALELVGTPAFRGLVIVAVTVALSNLKIRLENEH